MEGVRRTSHVVGARGEDEACVWLIERGYKILGRNYRTHRGEIDIIAESQGVIVFVEVKTRSKGHAEGRSAVHRIKQERIAKAAQRWLQMHPKAQTRFCRFDVMEVHLCHESIQIIHIPGAFEL